MVFIPMSSFLVCVFTKIHRFDFISVAIVVSWMPVSSSVITFIFVPLFRKSLFSYITGREVTYSSPQNTISNIVSSHISVMS